MKTPVIFDGRNLYEPGTMKRGRHRVPGHRPQQPVSGAA